MISEICPRCRCLRNLNALTLSEETTDSKGNLIKTVTISYYCTTCNSFIKSEKNTEVICKVKEVNNEPGTSCN